MKFLLHLVSIVFFAVVVSHLVAGKEPPGKEGYVAIPSPVRCRTRWLRGREGRFSSPNYPRNYYNNMRCTWMITVPRGMHVELRFLDFLLEEEARCRYDYVEVKSGSTVLGKFCGTTKPSPVVSTSGSLRITLVTDHSITKRGFMATYKAISPAIAKCPGSVPSLVPLSRARPSTILGYVSSPHYPRNYGNNQLCVWKLHVPRGYSVKLTFLDFELEGAPPSCRFDYVEVRNGVMASSPLLGKFCGRNRPPVIIANSGSMYITFKTDGSVTKKGFKAKYQPTY